MKFIWRNGWVPAKHFVRMPTSAPIVITDTCQAFKSMADGQVYESKRAYRTDLKARGMVETEGCNLPNRPPAGPAITQQDIAEAWDQFDGQTEVGLSREQAAGGSNGLPAGWEGDVA